MNCQYWLSISYGPILAIEVTHCWIQEYKLIPKPIKPFVSVPRTLTLWHLGLRVYERLCLSPPSTLNVRSSSVGSWHWHKGKPSKQANATEIRSDDRIPFFIRWHLTLPIRPYWRSAASVLASAVFPVLLAIASLRNEGTMGTAHCKHKRFYPVFSEKNAFSCPCT